MAVIPTQKFRFLGGEVSPNMYNSADMDQYGRWFSKAENIRFDTLGAFKNRTGFEKIADTKVSNGVAIKLLSFSFSREENYLIEMGPNYFRFFQNGNPIYIGGDPDSGVYEVAHDMSITSGDIKYAQSGDVLYLVNGVNPISTLTRNDTTGYNWTFSKFKFKDDCMPLGEVNTDDTKTLSITRTPSGTDTETWNITRTLENTSKYKDIVLTINGTSKTSTAGTEYTGFAGLKSAIWALIQEFGSPYFGFSSASIIVDASGITLGRSSTTTPIIGISIDSAKISLDGNTWMDWPAAILDSTKIVDDAGFIVTSSGFNIGDKESVGDIFGIEFNIDAESATINGSSQTAVDTTSNVIKTNGRFAFQTTGNWQGEIVLEYSLDGSTGWEVFRTVTSLNKSAPHNDNVAGAVTADSDLIYMRMRITSALTHDTYPLNAYLMGEKFKVISYYKIEFINSSTNILCTSVKNDFSIPSGTTVSGLTDWREGSFSVRQGYPSVVGFYQNRLIVGKEYMLYASKINQFDNFYEPSTLIADDPVTMSLLSNQYNRVRNILTVRKFFAFTEEGEFGIASQGALTQTDKNLLPISYHGSNPCVPILAGNLALFVDFSGRVVRLFQYSYETDSFEASDASVLLEQLLKGRTIITTDYLKNTKEALFLDNQGTIWIFKLMPEQEIYAWSHWEYAEAGKITNMRVVPDGANEELYIAVEDSDLGEKRIERLSTNLYTDSVKTYTSNDSIRRWFTDFDKDTVLIVDHGTTRSKIIVGENGLVEIPEPQTSIACHYSYTAEATLLSPVQNLTEGAMTTYNKGKPFKVHFCYQDSFGFKVGVQEEEKMYVRFNAGDRPETQELTSGKRSVLLPAKYDGSSRVSFVQERPYNMCVNNIMIDMDYGGK